MGFERLYIAFGASILTHPIVFFVFPKLGFETYWTMVSAAEAFVVITRPFICLDWDFLAQ